MTLGGRGLRYREPQVEVPTRKRSSSQGGIRIQGGFVGFRRNGS